MVELYALVQRYLAKSAAEGAMKGTSLGQGRWVLLTYIVANSPLQGHSAHQSYMPIQPL